MRKTIHEGNVGVFYKKGKIIKELGVGEHKYSLFRDEKIEEIDIRPVLYTESSSEYATKDNLMVRCAISLSCYVKSPTTLIRMTNNQYELITSNAVAILRSEVSQLTFDELLKSISVIEKNIEKRLTLVLDKYGIALESFMPLNLQIPRSLRQAFEAELTAKKRTLADLEEARGRTAVLRHLANAASQVEQHPALLQLLMGQKAKHVQFQFSNDKVKSSETKKSKQT